MTAEQARLVIDIRRVLSAKQIQHAWSSSGALADFLVRSKQLSPHQRSDAREMAYLKRLFGDALQHMAALSRRLEHELEGFESVTSKDANDGH
jgi:hypothetical protein